MASNAVTRSTEQTPARAENLKAGRLVAPPVDIYENDDELLVVADLPGVRKEDLRVNMENEVLTVEARRAFGDSGDVTGDWTYKRTFTVANVFDADKVNAVFENGVLRVKLPKAAAIRPRQIPIGKG